MSILGDTLETEQHDFFHDLATVEEDIEKLAHNALEQLREPVNLYRLLASAGGVMALSYATGERNIQPLATKGLMMLVAEAIGYNLAVALKVNGARELTSAGLYYLMATRSLNFNNVDQPIILEALAGAGGSYVASLQFDNRTSSQQETNQTSQTSQ